MGLQPFITEVLSFNKPGLTQIGVAASTSFLIPRACGSGGFVRGVTGRVGLAQMM